MTNSTSVVPLAGNSLAATSVGTDTSASPGTREESRAANWSRELIKEIAADIGADMVAYIEVMYPDAIKATSSTFKTSVRNHIYNQVMAAIEITDAAEIDAWLAVRKKFRREWVATYRRIRRSTVPNGES